MFNIPDLLFNFPGFSVHLPPDWAFKILRITQCLTPKGHDFLEAAQDDTRWNRAKDAIMERGLPVTVKVLGMVLQEYVKAEVRKFTGTG